jgi:hypothetical protein
MRSAVISVEPRGVLAFCTCMGDAWEIHGESDACTQ